MDNFTGRMFDGQGRFHPENLCDYGYHDVSNATGGKRGYVGIWLTTLDCFKGFQPDIDNGIRFGKIYMGVDNVESYVRSIVGEATWAAAQEDFDMPVPYPDAIEMRICRKGDELELLDTALRFSDTEIYPDDFTCRGCLDLQHFSEGEKKAILDKALDAVYRSYDLSRDNIMNRLVDWDKEKESTDDYYEGCLFDKNGGFHAENIAGVSELNDRSIDMLEATGPAQVDRFTVYFRGNGAFCWLDDDLEHGAKFDKSNIKDLGEYVDNAISNMDIGLDDYDCPVPKPDYMAVDIGVDNGEFEILGSRLYFYDADGYGVDLACDNYLNFDNFSDKEKAGIIGFALDTALGRGELRKDDVKNRLIDRNSGYAKLVAAAAGQADDEDENDDHGFDSMVDDLDDGRFPF